MQRLPCVVLAGGVPKPGEPLWEETRGAPKALLPLAGRPLGQWVLDALAESDGIGRVVLVGPEELAPLAHPELDRVASDGSLVDNLYAGIDRLIADDPTIERAAYCWSDIPLIRGPMIDRFLDATVGWADVEAGLVPRRRLEQRFPSLDESWLRFREGEFVAADFGVFRPRMANAVRPHLEALAPQRKNALRQARLVGLGLLFAYLFRRLGLRGLEQRLERRYAIRARLQQVADPELGLDVDGPVNLANCRRVLDPGARG